MGDTYNMNGWIIGGRKNIYGDSYDDPEARCDEQKPSDKVEIVPSKQMSVLEWIEKKLVKSKPSNNKKGHYRAEIFGEHPSGAFSVTYTFIPYQNQYPSLTPYQHGGYGGPSQMAALPAHGYYGDYLEPGGYNYGHVAATDGAPIYGHEQHNNGNKELGQDHNHSGERMHKGSPPCGATAAGIAANGHRSSCHNGGRKIKMDSTLSKARCGATSAASATPVAYDAVISSKASATLVDSTPPKVGGVVTATTEPTAVAYISDETFGRLSSSHRIGMDSHRIGMEPKQTKAGGAATAAASATAAATYGAVFNNRTFAYSSGSSSRVEMDSTPPKAGGAASVTAKSTAVAYISNGTFGGLGIPIG